MSARIIGTLGGCLVLVAVAHAELDVVLRNGDTVRGTFLPATETETFRFACPAGAKLRISAASRARGMRVAATLIDPQDVAAGGASGRGARIRGVRAAESGLHRVEVSSADGVTTGDYAIRVGWTSPRSFAQTTSVAEDSTADLAFSADAGAHVTFTLTPPRGSAATPSLVRVRSAEGTTFLLAAGAKGTFVVPKTDSYTMRFENGAAAGDVVARAAVRPPKAARRRLAATTREIPPGTDVVAAAVLDAAGGVVAAPATGPLADARVVVPGGALAGPAIVVIGTASEIAPPNPPGSTRATPPAFVGPLGTTFAPAAHPTVELPLEVSGDVPVDAALRVYASGGMGPDLVPGADTDGTLVTFAPALLTRFQGYYVVLAEVAVPFVVDTMTERALGAVAMGGGYAFIASPYSYEFYEGGAVGEGLVRVFQRVGTTWVERGSLRSPVAVDSDIFGATVAYRTSPTDPADDSVLVGTRDVDGPGVNGKENPAIFEFTRTGQEWTYLRQLPAVETYNFTVDGDRLLAAGWANLFSATDLRRGAQGWSAAESLTIGHAAADLDLRGGTLLVGAPYSEPPGAHTGGSAYRFDVSGASAVELVRYSAPAPEQQDNFFGETVSLGANYAAVKSERESPGVTIFRLADDARDAAITMPVLPAYGPRSPVFGGFRMHGDTLLLTALTYSPGWPFAGGYVFKRVDGTWTQTATFDATPWLDLEPVSFPLAGDVASDGTTVVVSITVSSGSSPQTFRAAAAFFELPLD
jgi:hypothetical protein